MPYNNGGKLNWPKFNLGNLNSYSWCQLSEMILHDYYFIWDRDIKSSCIALGYGSLYNHSDNANAEFLNDYESNMIRILAIADIPAHQEICINYISKDEEEFTLWFENK